MSSVQTVMRDAQLNIRLSEEEKGRLDAVCAHLGINAANLFRMMLKEKARALGLEHTSLSEASKNLVDAKVAYDRQGEANAAEAKARRVPPKKR